MVESELNELRKSVDDWFIIKRQNDRISDLMDLLEDLVLAIDHGESLGVSFALSEARAELKKASR